MKSLPRVQPTQKRLNSASKFRAAGKNSPKHNFRLSDEEDGGAAILDAAEDEDQSSGIL